MTPKGGYCDLVFTLNRTLDRDVLNLLTSSKENYMLFNEIHTLRDQNKMIQGAQLTGVTKEFDERPDYVCILENADGTCVCSEWLRDDEFTFTPNY